ncbi:MAG: 4Fe-4S binding protein [Bradymonadales bacterium]|nr:4Fe-4S binding protein [Bradymonadales bacterium]
MAIHGGFMGKILDVDLSSSTISQVPISDRDKEIHIGGRALGVKILLDNLPAGTNPLSCENILVFTPGVLTGSGAPCTGRFNLSTKSPLTGAIGSSNCGGDFGTYLKWAGYDGLIIRGAADHPVMLEIIEDKIRILDARHLWGLDTAATQEALPKKTGKAVIGPAGEHLVRFASIMSGHRALGRTGVGAVMGTKNLKAIYAAGSRRVPIHDTDGFFKVVQEWTRLLHNHPLTGIQCPEYGTAANMNPCNVTRTLPTRNFQAGHFDEAFEVSGEAMTERYLATNSNCVSCPIRCGRVVRHDGKEIKGPEYETLGMLGPNIGNSDIQAIFEWNELLDRLGMDTITTGSTLACAMELVEKGHLQADLAFGRTDNIASIIEDIAYRRGLGDDLAEGSLRLAAKYGAPQLSMSVKGLEMAAYEPRHAVGHGLGYAVANRGGCHLNSGYLVFFEALGQLTMDPLTPVAKPAWNVFQQNLMEAVSISGNCVFTTYAVIPPVPTSLVPGHSTIAKLVSNVLLGTRLLLNQQGRMAPWLLPMHIPLIPHSKAIEKLTGIKMSLGKFSALGERGYTLDRLFNLREGLTAADDTLPPRMTDEPEEKDNPKTVVPLAEMLPVYYRVRDWDEQGIPTERLLKKLQLDEYLPLLSEIRANQTSLETRRQQIRDEERPYLEARLAERTAEIEACLRDRDELLAAFDRAERQSWADEVRGSSFRIDSSKCRECGLCVKACPVKAISPEGGTHIKPEICISCGTCYQTCPPHFHAVVMTPNPQQEKERKAKRYEVIVDKCMKCGICYRHCPVSAITWKKKELAFIHQELCVQCGRCHAVCPPKFDAIAILSAQPETSPGGEP